jgi:hypothetical protein
MEGDMGTILNAREAVKAARPLVAIAGVSCWLIGSPLAYAETPAPVMTDPGPHIATPIRDAVANIRVSPAPRAENRRLVGPVSSGPAGQRLSRPTRAAIFTAIGVVGGIYAGACVGAAIEGDSCRCDDPGLKGALIGIPIGAAGGGSLGWMLGR